MATVNNESGFTQLDKLNVREEFLVQGSPVGGGGATPKNTVVVNSESDLPAPSGGFINLVNDTAYLLGDSFSISTPIKLPNNCQIFSNLRFTQSLTYTGTGAMFTGATTGTNPTVAITNVGLSCPNAKLFDFTSPSVGGATLNIEGCISIECDSLADLENVNVFSLVGSFVSCNSGGILFIGQTGVVNITGSSMFTPSTSGITFIDFGTADSPSFELSDVTFTGDSSNTAISGAASSANVVPGFIGNITGCVMFGGVIPLSGIQDQDARWRFRDNNNIENSRAATNSYLSAPRETPIAATNVYVPIGGADWLCTVEDKFTCAVNGQLTYIGEADLVCYITGTATVSKVGGGTDTVAMRIAVNNITEAQSEAETNNASPTSVVSQSLITLTQNDQIDLQVANETTTANIDVTQATLIAIAF